MALNLWNEIGKGFKTGYDFLKGIWNDLTGITAEKENVVSTNAANAQSVAETNQANKDIQESVNKSNIEQQNLANKANIEIANQTNQMNYDVAMQNLGFQRELQEYNKALQQQMFEREDTSYQRTTKDMLAAGLNPLSMQGTNGSGEAIALSPLNNSFQAQQSSPMTAAVSTAAQMQANKYEKANLPVITGNQILSSISSLIEGINQLKTGQLQRDALKLQNDRQYIENNLLANDNGIVYKPGDYKHITLKYITEGENTYSPFFDRAQSKYFDYQNAIREYKHKVDIGRYDSDTDLEKMFTAIMDWTVNGRSEEQLNKLREKYPLIDMALRFIDGYKK